MTCGSVAVQTRLVEDVSRTAGFALHPLLGGGTRLMLSLHHRLSDDIDLFIRDPQWIGYLTPYGVSLAEAVEFGKQQIGFYRNEG